MAPKRTRLGRPLNYSAPKRARATRGTRGRLPPELCSPAPDLHAETGAEATTLPPPEPSASALREHSSPSEESVGTSSSACCEPPASSEPGSSGMEEIETMRGTPGDSGEAVNDDAMGCSVYSLQEPGGDLSAPNKNQGLAAEAIGPFNSTMVEGGIPIHEMTVPTMPKAGPSGGPLKGLNLADVPLPVMPDVIPPCPLGVYWKMQLEELQRTGDKS